MDCCLVGDMFSAEIQKLYSVRSIMLTCSRTVLKNNAFAGSVLLFFNVNKYIWKVFTFMFAVWWFVEKGSLE